MPYGTPLIQFPAFNSNRSVPAATGAAVPSPLFFFRIAAASAAVDPPPPQLPLQILARGNKMMKELTKLMDW